MLKIGQVPNNTVYAGAPFTFSQHPLLGHEITKHIGTYPRSFQNEITIWNRKVWLFHISTVFATLDSCFSVFPKQWTNSRWRLSERPADFSYLNATDIFFSDCCFPQLCSWTFLNVFRIWNFPWFHDSAKTTGEGGDHPLQN